MRGVEPGEMTDIIQRSDMIHIDHVPAVGMHIDEPRQYRMSPDVKIGDAKSPSVRDVSDTAILHQQISGSEAASDTDVRSGDDHRNGLRAAFSFT
jgi:hypothetical protein